MPLKPHRSRRRMSTLHDVNITNLVDVALTILIMFLLITPLIQEGFNVNLPKTKNPETIMESDAILVVMRGEDEITVNGLRVAADRVADHVLAAHQSAPEKPVVIKAQDSLEYGKVIGLIDAIRGTGITTVGLETKRLAADERTNP